MATLFQNASQVSSILPFINIMKMIQSLSPAGGIILNLTVLEEFDEQQIADCLHISPGTARTNLLKVKRQSQNKLFCLLCTLKKFSRIDLKLLSNLIRSGNSFHLLYLHFTNAHIGGDLLQSWPRGINKNISTTATTRIK